MYIIIKFLFNNIHHHSKNYRRCKFTTTTDRMDKKRDGRFQSGSGESWKPGQQCLSSQLSCLIVFGHCETVYGTA